MDEPLAPVAVSENAKFKALALIELGYSQSKLTIKCPLCERRYLLLVDVRSREQSIVTDIEKQAVEFFAVKIFEGHVEGHREERIERELHT